MELLPEEVKLLKLCKKQKLWGFLREHRHLLLDEEIRAALHRLNLDCGLGRPPVPPEQLALAMLLQVAFQVADHEVPVLTASCRRWQMVLGSLGETEPLFSQGTVFNFRERVREAGIMDMLLEKTVKLARETRGFGHTRLRAIFDSSPLTGAGRVEDTFNLLGRAIRQLANLSADIAGLNIEDLAEELNLTVVSSPSVKAALDIDWRLPDSRKLALKMLIDQFDALRTWHEETFGKESLKKPPLEASLLTVEKIIEQDTEPDPDPSPGTKAERVIKQQAGGDRIISLSDPDMRHGRKSKSRGIAGFKQHVAVDADVPGLIVATVALAANQPEAEGATPLFQALDGQGFQLEELQTDRGYVPNEMLNERRRAGLKIISKPPAITEGSTFGKHRFDIDFERRTATCPAGKLGQFCDHRSETARQQVRWSANDCGPCELRTDCLGEASKRPAKKILLHANEEWFREMSEELATPDGRASRRERVAVEHTLAHVVGIQGRQARFKGLKKVDFDLTRAAVVNNLFVLARSGPRSRAA